MPADGSHIVPGPARAAIAATPARQPSMSSAPGACREAIRPAAAVAGFGAVARRFAGMTSAAGAMPAALDRRGKGQRADQRQGENCEENAGGKEA